jgi:gliding motility-associated-like protein
MNVVIDQLPTPIISTDGATCTADGKSTITNYNSNLTYTFTPAGPSINPNGEIINAVTGTSYTVSSSNGTTCNSQQSAPFVNAPMQNTLPAPAITTTQPDCSTDGTASITNYSSNYTYVFTPAGPTVNTNGTINNLTFGTSYTVIASTNGGSCQSQPSTPFSVAGKLSKPTVSIKGNSTICSGGITNLILESPQQGATLTWTTSATGNIAGYSNGSGTTILQTLTGADNSSVTYVVTPTLNGCIGDSVSFTVSISKGNLDAAFTASPQQITPYNSTVHFTNLSQGATAYLWNFGENNATSNLKDPTYTYKGESEQNYSVILIASDNKGCKDTATVIVKMVDDVVFFVPNAFTPDGDEFNNTFKPVFAQGFDAYEYELLIFDRWGEVIFESHNVTYGWDGTYLGKMCPDGTYVWRISIKKKEQVERIQKSGHITLLK